LTVASSLDLFVTGGADQFTAIYARANRFFARMTVTTGHPHLLAKMRLALGR